MFQGPKSPWQIRPSLKGGVVIATEQSHDGCDLLVGERDTAWLITDIRVHLAAFSEGLAVDPAQNVTAMVVVAEPAGRRIETCALEMHEYVAHQLRGEA
jgi:aspartyl aminopeptidase